MSGSSGERRALTGAAFARAATVAKMLAAAPWLDEARCNLLLDGTQEERTLVISARAMAHVTEGPEAWDHVVAVLVDAGAAATVAGIVSALQGVYGRKL